DQIPASAPADDFMHAHKWKRGVRENVATVKEIRRKASKIAPAYNKGALQYLPDESLRPSSQPLTRITSPAPISACPLWVSSNVRFVPQADIGRSKALDPSCWFVRA